MGKCVNEGTLAVEGTPSSFAFSCLISPSSSFALDLSAFVEIQTTTCANGDQPLLPPPSVRRGPHVGEAAAWLVGGGIRWADPSWNHSSHQPVARRDISFHLLCVGRVRIPSVFLLPHPVGDLWAPAPPSDTTRPHFGGGLHPTLRDVHRLFSALRTTGRSSGHLGAYYF
jgi:hypothetical protein